MTAIDCEAEKNLIKDSVTVMAEALQEEFLRVPGDIAYWSARYAAAYREALLREVERREVEARAWLEEKAAPAAQAGEKTKGPTVDDLKARVAVRDDVHAAALAEVEAAAEKERVRGVLDAVRAKKDMVVSIGAAQRAELEGDPALRREARIRDRERAAERVAGSGA